MHYELYIDVLFLINFMMDSLLLFAVRGVMGCRAPTGRVLLGGMLGAGLTCGIIAVPMPGVLKYVLLYGVVSAVMVKAGLGIRTRKTFFQAVALLYVSAFLMGGILQALHPYVRTGSLFFAAAVSAYAILSGIWKMLTKLKATRVQVCEVVLYMENSVCHAKALADTGNVLTDPISGEPVHVVDKGVAEELLPGGASALLQGEAGRGVRYIPYRTVGGSGVMPVVRIEKMCVQIGGGIEVLKPVIGICGEMISEQEEYQMILNPAVLGGAEYGSKSSSTGAV